MLVNARPALVLLVLDGTDFVFSFATIAGKTYAVEYKDSIEETVWQTLQTVPGDGTIKTVTNSVVSPTQRCYRLNVQ